MNAFIKEITQYLADHSSSRFTFTNGSNLNIGELNRGVNGVFVQAVPSVPPDIYTEIEYHHLDFYARNVVSETALQDLQVIYSLFHQAHHYQTDSHYIHFSYAAGQPDDLDRDGEGRKLYRVSVIFITMSLIS